MKVDFCVCEKLAIVYVLGGDVCDKFVNEIYQRERIVELDYGTKIPTIRKRSKRGEELSPIPENIQDSQHEGRFSHKIRVARSIILQPKRQTTVIVSTNRFGLMAYIQKKSFK